MRKMNIKRIIILIAAVLIIAIAGCVLSVMLKTKDEKIPDSSAVISSEPADTENQTDKADDKTLAQNGITNEVSAESTSENSSKTSKSNVSENTSASQDADADGLTTEQTVEILTDFYGSTYRVETGEYNGGYQKFDIIDKKGNAYAAVKVELSSGEATETIIQTNEVNKYNLLV